MGKILELLEKKNFLLADGAWGTIMQAIGMNAGECPELWNISHRDEIYNIAKSYINSGSDIIETNSFGANKFRLEHYGFENRVKEFNKTAAEISREAAGTDKFVVGSIGPSGKMLMMGDVTEEELYDTFAEQAIALKEGGVDGYLIETFSAIDEALCAIKVVKENSSLEIICTFTFEKTVFDDYKTMMGIDIADMVSAITGAGAEIIGTNCGNGIERMVEIISEMKKFSGNTPLAVNSNAGLPVIHNGHIHYDGTPEMMSAFIPAILDSGARIIGGCCGTTPEHIKLFRKILDKRNSN